MVSKYGSEETMTSIDDLGSSQSTYSFVKDGVKSLVSRRYFHSSIVNDTKKEMEQYIEFSKKIESLRESGKLYFEKNDRSTWPCFYMKFAHNNVDGKYIVVQHWMEKHDLFGN